MLLIATIYRHPLRDGPAHGRRALADRARRDAVPALLLAAGTALFVLVQMGTLENWLETTRVTFLTMTIVAIAIKEFDAIHGDEA